MEKFKAILRKVGSRNEESTTQEKVPSGLEKYKQWCAELLDVFERNFDPVDKTRTQDIYNQAKRLSRIIEGSGSELAYSGIFGDSASALGPIPRKHLSERNERAKDLGAQIGMWLGDMERAMVSLIEVVNKKTLETEHGAILSLKSEQKKGVSVNDFPFTRSYIDQLQIINRRAEDYASTLRAVKDTNQIIRREDLQAISTIYRSINLDRNFWEAFHNDIMSTDSRIYNGGFLNNLQKIHFEYLEKICDVYERAYSKDGLSEGDKSIQYLLGVRGDKDLGYLGDDAIPDLSIPEGFIEQKTFFHTLQIEPKDLVGKTEAEIKKLLRGKYYDLARKCHPDIPANKGREEEFKKLDEAYRVLVDPQKRSDYVKYGN